jgi:hypothetical protein
MTTIDDIINDEKLWNQFIEEMWECSYEKYLERLKTKTDEARIQEDQEMDRENLNKLFKNLSTTSDNYLVKEYDLEYYKNDLEIWKKCLLKFVKSINGTEEQIKLAEQLVGMAEYLYHDIEKNLVFGYDAKREWYHKNSGFNENISFMTYDDTDKKFNLAKSNADPMTKKIMHCKQRLHKSFTNKKDKHIYDTFAHEIIKNYEHSKERLDDLEHDQDRSRSAQTDWIKIYGYKYDVDCQDLCYTISNIRNLAVHELPIFPFKVSKIKFDKLYISHGKMNDLWSFVTNKCNYHVFKNNPILMFTEGLGECKMLDYFNNMIHKNHIKCKISNHSSAMYYFDGSDDTLYQIQPKGFVETIKSYFSNDKEKSMRLGKYIKKLKN